jgi:hypothetical protein
MADDGKIARLEVRLLQLPADLFGLDGSDVTEQLSIVDGLAEGERLRDASMAQVARANPQWSDYADAALLFVAERREFFSSDAIWAVLGMWSVEEPTDRRALGPVLKRAANAELIESTGRVIKSSRAICHASPKLVYRSLVWHGRARRDVAGHGLAWRDMVGQGARKTGDGR